MKLRKQETQKQVTYKKLVTRAEMLMFCLAARAHDKQGRLVWSTLPWN
jgi:hypothetical protein